MNVKLTLAEGEPSTHDPKQTLTEALISSAGPCPMESDEVAAALERVDADGCDAVVMTGTGMITIPAILEYREGMTAPLLSSNLCMAWWIMRTVGSSGSDAFAEACPALNESL